MDDHQPQLIPDHESPVRRTIADANGTPYHALETRQEAQAHPEGVVILEGDDGGQIYLTCPGSQVRCSEAALDQLLEDIDALAWDDLSAARVFYERLPLGSTVVGGMGGGKITDGLWVHAQLADMGLTAHIAAVLDGSRDRITDEPPDQPFPSPSQDYTRRLGAQVAHLPSPAPEMMWAQPLFAPRSDPRWMWKPPRAGNC